MKAKEMLCGQCKWYTNNEQEVTSKSREDGFTEWCMYPLPMYIDECEDVIYYQTDATSCAAFEAKDE
jgi:hypothetical protein